MIPNFSILGKTFSVYMILALIGVFVTLIYIYKMSVRLKYDEIEALKLSIFAFAGAAIGGHILYGFTNFSDMIKLFSNLFSFSSFGEFVNRCTEVFGGSVFYGGLIAVLTVALIHMKATKNKYSELYDIGASAIPLFHGFGRIGCFLSGCCYGTESSIGVIYYHSPVSVANGIRRFPIQLVEAAFNFAIFAFLFYCLKKAKFKGRMIAIYLISYSTVRFILEFFRGDDYRGFVGLLSTSQFISIILFTLAILYLAVKSAQSKRLNK